MTRIGVMRRWAIASAMLTGILVIGAAWTQPVALPDHPRVSCILFVDGRFIVVAPSLSRPAQERALELAWAGPSSPRTTIPFRLTGAAEVRIDIWDMSGRRVRRLAVEGATAGDHQMTWDGRDDDGRSLPNGTYFYRMAINGRAVAGAGRALSLR